MIGIIDYDAGNIRNLQNALNKLKLKNKVVSNFNQFSEVDKLILPGVGAFGAMMKYLKQVEMVKPIQEWIADSKPFLGICLGYQALFENSQEAEGIQGLNVLSGSVRRFTLGKVPQIGWNTTQRVKPSEVFSNEFYYFVHSYYPDPDEQEIIAVTTNYYIDFASGIEINNIVATQFHPERSGEKGLAFLKRWS